MADFSWLLNVFRSSCTRSNRSFSHESQYPSSRTSADPESPLLARRSLHAVLCGFAPDDIFTVQALWTADSQISCVCAQCARRAAAQVAPDTGTSMHAHTPGSRECLQSRELPSPPASLQPPEWLLNLPTVPTDPILFSPYQIFIFFTYRKKLYRNHWGVLFETFGIQYCWVLTSGPLGRALVTAEDLVIDAAKEAL